MVGKKTEMIFRSLGEHQYTKRLVNKKPQAKFAWGFLLPRSYSILSMPKHINSA